MREPTNGDRYGSLFPTGESVTWIDGPWVLVLRGYVAMAVHEERGTVVPWHAIARLGAPLPPLPPVVTPDPWKGAGE